MPCVVVENVISTWPAAKGSASSSGTAGSSATRRVLPTIPGRQGRPTDRAERMARIAFAKSRKQASESIREATITSDLLLGQHSPSWHGLMRVTHHTAMRRTMQAADIAGIRAFAIHAKDEAARACYQNFDFIPSPTDPLHLFLRIKDLRRVAVKT